MNEELRFPVEKLVYGGDGLGHCDGQTVFVPYVLPGEEVRARVISKKKNLVRARLEEVVKPAGERTQPACRHFGTCGGCHYQHISYESQLSLKSDILRETLSRLGGIKWEGPIALHPSPPHGYRNRAQWAARPRSAPGLGYYRQASSEVCEITECPVLSPGLAKLMAHLQTAVGSGAIGGGLKEIEAFADSEDKRFSLNVAYDKFLRSSKELAAAIRGDFPGIESILLGDESTGKFQLSGPGFIHHEAGGHRYRVSHLSFFQVNRFLVAELLKAMTGGRSGKVALDLYAGVGFFSLPLAQSFEQVITVDANLAATHDLRANAEAAGLKLDWHHENAGDFLKRKQPRPDLVVLDPPRAGLGEETSARLAQAGAPEILYLSCDPATLARDLAVLLHTAKTKPDMPSGAVRYELAEVHLFDLFPQTYHIETFVRLKAAP